MCILYNVFSTRSESKPVIFFFDFSNKNISEISGEYLVELKCDIGLQFLPEKSHIAIRK